MTNELLLTDGQRIHRRILECPEDDAPRLIYSDWLEEKGEEERARFIRLQIEEHYWPCPVRNPALSIIRGICPCPFRKTRRRNNLMEMLRVKDGIEEIGASYTRGFISEVRLTCEQFCGGLCQACDGDGSFPSAHAPGPGGQMFMSRDCPQCNGTGRIEGVARELFERHPLTSVRLIDRKPGYYMNVNRRGHSWYWVRGTQETMHFDTRIPAAICEHLTGYFHEENGVHQFDTEALTIAALSAACVSYGRSLAGLPALEGVGQLGLPASLVGEPAMGNYVARKGELGDE